MVKIIGLEAMLHISYGMAALVFAVVLYVLVCALGTGQVHHSLTFRTLTVTVVIGDLLSILDNIFRDAGVFPTPVPVKLLLLLLVFYANVLLTYYMALYMEGFFGDFRYRQAFFFVNTLLVVSAGVFTATIYFYQLVHYRGEAMLTTVPIWVNVLIGYAFELYFLIYAVTLFIRLNGTLTRRARITSVAAFAVTIGSVLFELLNTFGIGSGIMYNYFGAVIGLYIFYIGVETPDYRNLLRTVTDLDEAKKVADETSRAQADFIADMSRETREPVRAMLAVNDKILNRTGDAVIRSFTGTIRRTGTELLERIGNRTTFSEIEAGTLQIVPTEYDPTIVIRDLVDIFRLQAEEKGLVLKSEVDADLPRRLCGDEEHLRQVIANLLANAVRYTERGSVTLHVGFEKPANTPDAVILQVAVRDTGIGIRSDDMPKLFSDFDQPVREGEQGFEEKGFGLSVARRLLQLMGSVLRVESTYGIGSTFSFDIKQQTVSGESAGDPAFFGIV